MDEILESMTDIANLHNGQYNAAAIATSLNSLNTKPSENEDRGWRDDWIDVKCSDGTKARILKNPDRTKEVQNEILWSCCIVISKKWQIDFSCDYV